MSLKKIWILRLTHRRERDKRVTTHIGLVARAFGATGMYYSGEKDLMLEEKIADVCRRWGGDFKIMYTSSPIDFVKSWKKEGGLVIHLTMYGISLPKVINSVRNTGNMLIILGSEKVERLYYELADYNISITNQPHSEIAALAVFLDYFYRGSEFEFEFKGGKFKVVPCKKGKKVVKLR